MDVRAIKAAGRTELTACAFAAARNAQGLLHDAEILAGAGSMARACSLAALTVEECGKALALAALSMLPQARRKRAPVGRMLEWHQLKHVGGLLVAAAPFDGAGLAAKLAAMPAAQVTQLMCTLSEPADEADHLKLRGLYVDMDRTGRVREPSEITGADATSQLARARQAAASAAMLFEPEARARLANPPAEAIRLAVELVNALSQTQMRDARSPEAAAKIMMNAVSNLRDCER